MENTKNDRPIGDPNKFYFSMLVIFAIMFRIMMQPFMEVHATVVDGGANVLSGANNRFVNISNSGAYAVGFSLSGTLDPGNTLAITAMDGSGKTATGTFLSLSGGESSGSVLLNLSGNSWHEGMITFSGMVHSGSVLTPVVASGMSLTGTLDTTPPGISLSSLLSTTITGATSVVVRTTEVTNNFEVGDISVTNAGVSSFSVQSGTGYSFVLTSLVSTGIVRVSVGTGMFSDAAGNTNLASNMLSYNVGTTTDTISPLVAITSYASGAIVSGSPTFSGTMSDTGGIAQVSVNGALATLGSGTWSKVVNNLVAGPNTITVVAMDLSGNTGSTSIVVNRVALASSINADLSGSTGAVISFVTDLSATGVLRYGTNSGSLNLGSTGTFLATTHAFTLSGLTPNTVYYFTVQGQSGIVSPIFSFKTPMVLDITTANGNITITSSVYLSGSTGTGATFLGSGVLDMPSLTSSGSFLRFPFNGLVIASSGMVWDGVLQGPEVTTSIPSLSLSGYAFTGTAYQIGNPHTELIFSGQYVVISLRIGSTSSGQIARVYRSTDHGVTYSLTATCTINNLGDCVFSTNQLSLFAVALPADTVPDAFSFPGITGVNLSTQYTSNTVTITGITGRTSLSIVGGQYSLDGAPFTSVSGLINSGSTVVLRATSAGSYSTVSNTTITIGGVSSTFSLTTKASSGGGTSSGGGGGGGGWLAMDECGGNDYSPSYYDGTCGTMSTGGGNLDTGGNIITGISTGSFNIPPIIITSFADINVRDVVGNWAESYILRLVVRGIVDNVEYFRPDANLTRAEFLKIVINTTGWQVPTTGLVIPFNDVSPSAWYAPYVSLAISKDMIRSDRTSFDPNDTITRAEATKILMVALGVTVNTPTALSFVDLDLESDLTQYIEAAKYLNILDGQISYGRAIFRPNDAITRSEIAKIIVNAFHL